MLGNGEKIGVLGGGQLGLMLKQAAEKMNVELFFLDPDPHAPCAQFKNNFTQGDFKSEDDVLAFGKDKDILTIEIENVNTTALKQLKSSGIKVFPDPELIDIVKDKGLQKEFYRKNSIPTSPFINVNFKEEFITSISSLPVVQKLRTGGYDGRGVQVFKEKKDLAKAFDGPSVLEHFVPFEREISVLVARNVEGRTNAYASVGMNFSEEANLVEFLYSPSQIDDKLESKAQKVAHDLAQAFKLVGIMAVEMFLTPEGHVLVNEVAPRPHNSGHQSIEGNKTSQYEQHLRAILGLDLGDTTITKPSVMVNILGAKDNYGKVVYEGLGEYENDPEVFIHLYDKKETKPFRKMGHVTVLADDIEEAIRKGGSVKEKVKCISEDAVA